MNGPHGLHRKGGGTMGTELMPWWVREKRLTEKDKEAIRKARSLRWADIDESSAETEEGRYELRRIVMDKYHREEYAAGLA